MPSSFALFAAALCLLAVAIGSTHAEEAISPQIESLLGLSEFGVESVGSDLAPATDIIVPGGPFPLPAPCRGVEAASSGYQFRYITGGRYFARACPSTGNTNCVQILPCPSSSARCFEALVCTGSCRRFTPCCNGQYRLEAAEQGYRFIPGKKYLRQTCGNCFTLNECPAGATGCEDLATCVGIGCSRISPCTVPANITTTAAPTTTTTTTAATTTTTTTTTTNTPPCVGYRLQIVPVGFRLVSNNLPTVPSIKRVPCGSAAGCFQFQACNVEDVRSGVCVTREVCNSLSSKPNCYALQDCGAATTSTTPTTTTTTTTATCSGIRESNSATGYTWILNLDPATISVKKTRCPNDDTCTQLSGCTDADFKSGVQCFVRRECKSADGSLSCLSATKC